MDDYQDEKESIYAKTISQTFCAISWAGESESDIPQVYYFNTGVQNQLPCEEDQQTQVIISLIQKTIGLAMAIKNITGRLSWKNSNFETITFQSDGHIIAVRQVYRYHIVLCLQQPCSETAILSFMELTTQIMCQSTDIQQSDQQQNKPPQAPFNSDSLNWRMLDIAFFRFSEDIDARNYLLLTFHLVQLPHDNISVNNIVISTVESVKEYLEQTVDKPIHHLLFYKDRSLFTTVGPFMHNYMSLYANMVNQGCDIEVNWALGKYFDQQDDNDKLTQTIYTTIFKYNEVIYVILSQNKLSLEKDIKFQQKLYGRLSQIHRTLQEFFHLPNIYPQHPNQCTSLSVPITDQLALSGIDRDHCYWSFCSINTDNISKKQIQQLNLGKYLVDGYLMNFLGSRLCNSISCIMNQNKDFSASYSDAINDILAPQGKGEEFYAFSKTLHNPLSLLSNCIETTEKPLILQALRNEKAFSCGVFPITEIEQEVLKRAKEWFQIYLKTYW